MAQSTWQDVQFKYYWSENERLKAAIEDGRFDTTYTMPGLKSDETLPDKMAQTVFQMTGNQVTRPTVPQTLDGLKQLIGSGHLRSAYNLTTVLLANYGQGVGKAGYPTKNTFETFEIWSGRFQLMVALKMFSQLEAELSAFDNLDAPDTYFQYYPELNQQGYCGSMIPYSLRLIHAEAPKYFGRAPEAIQRCYELEKNTRTILEWLKNEKKPANELDLWKSRLEVVLMAKARIWYSMKEFGQSMSIYNSLLDVVSDEKRSKLLQLLSRIAVVIGDEKLVERYTRELTIQNSGTQNFYLHKSFKAAFYGNYPKALEHLQTAQKGTGGLSNPMVIIFIAQKSFDAFSAGKQRSALSTLQWKS
uniref:Uncharacterized protein n=1 Tax=Panagrolaimus sp. JU765 TaxID=591449 RepID=A0AC34QP66_9BILA